MQSLAFCLASYFQSSIKGLEVEVHKRPIFVSTSAGRCCWWRWSHRECSYQSLHRPVGAGRHRPRQDVHRDNHCLPDILGTTFSGHPILIRRLQDGDALNQVWPLNLLSKQPPFSGFTCVSTSYARPQKLSSKCPKLLNPTVALFKRPKGSVV